MAAAKTSRLGLRLTGDERAVVEQAARLSGSTVAGWAVSALAGRACREISAAAATDVPGEHWNEFAALLDQPPDPRTTELLARTPVWEPR
jgi:uncharacterized protein (DUF1778 family)